MNLGINYNVADKDIAWFKKLVPKSCRVIKKNILDVRIAMEECENDEECVAVSDEGCNMKGFFGICTQLATFSSANNCVYQKKKGDIMIHFVFF